MAASDSGAEADQPAGPVSVIYEPPGGRAEDDLLDLRRRYTTAGDVGFVVLVPKQRLDLNAFIVLRTYHVAAWP